MDIDKKFNDNLYGRYMHDLPIPPQEIIDGINLDITPDHAEYHAYRRGPQRYLKNWDMAPTKAARNIRLSYDILERWARENITENLLDAGINYVFVEPGTGPVSTGAHTDVRNFVLLFPILQGGANAKLTFWREQGEDIIRPSGAEGVDMSCLTMLEQITLSKKCWVLANTRVLHGVENLYSTRVNLQISLADNIL